MSTTVGPVGGPAAAAAAGLLCGDRRARPFTRRMRSRILRCDRCGLVYVDPLPTPEAVGRHYNEGHSSRVRYYIDAEAADRRSFAEILDRVARFLPARGRLLDVGPNIGACLALARERGWTVRGVEINENAARYCREARGLDVASGPLETESYPPESFDLVLMLDVIEHLLDPLDAARRVHRVLKPSGVVCWSVSAAGARAGSWGR